MGENKRDLVTALRSVDDWGRIQSFYMPVFIFNGVLLFHR